GVRGSSTSGVGDHSTGSGGGNGGNGLVGGLKERLLLGGCIGLFGWMLSVILGKGKEMKEERVERGDECDAAMMIGQ
uniref:hypothetical protein n=1 Tax=Paenibacillus xylanexedens TaxID=528191 RepID=UPI001C930294